MGPMPTPWPHRQRLADAARERSVHRVTGVVARNRPTPGIHPERDAELLPGPGHYNPEQVQMELRGPRWNEQFLVSASRYHKVKNPWGMNDVWRHVVTGLCSPGPAYLPQEATSVPPKQGFTFAPRHDIVDNLMQGGMRTAAETPGPGAHDPVAEPPQRVPSIGRRLPKRQRICPGPQCYDTEAAVRHVHRSSSACCFSRAARAPLFPEPRPGTASPGPQQLGVTDALCRLHEEGSPLKGPLRPVRRAGSAAGRGSLATDRRWRTRVAPGPGPLYYPSRDAVAVTGSRACSLGPRKLRGEKPPLPPMRPEDAFSAGASPSRSSALSPR